MKSNMNTSNFFVYWVMIVIVVNLCTANSHSNNLQSKAYQNHNNRLNHHHQQNIIHHRQHNEYHPNHNRTRNLNSTGISTKSWRELDQNNMDDNSNKISTNSSIPVRLRRINNYGVTYHQQQNPQFYNSNKQPSYSDGFGRDNRSGRDYRPVSVGRNDVGQQSEKSVPSVGSKNGIQQDVETFRYDNGWQIPKNSDPTSSTENPNRDNEDRRHICMQQKTVQIPIKTTEVYSRPIFRQITEPCNTNHLCTRIHVFHEPTYRDVITHKQSKQISYDCCQGWTKISKDSIDCLKPICRMKCKNGGTCTKPDTCTCLPGFTGRFCETDINECKENKPCDQICHNTDGSYYCKCKEGFRLHTDMQSCKKIVTEGRDIAFEARDLENEIDIDNGNDVSSRVHHIEKILENERVKTHELEKSLQSTYYTVNSLKSRLSTLEHMQQPLQESLIAYGTKTKKLENLINLLIKCRKNPNPTYCP